MSRGNFPPVGYNVSTISAPTPPEDEGKSTSFPTVIVVAAGGMVDQFIYASYRAFALFVYLKSSFKINSVPN